MRHSWRAGLCCLLAFLTTGFVVQDGPDPDPVLRGQLLRVEVPADSGTVVLHRVNPEQSGPVDSIRVDPDGSFRFELGQLPVAGSGEILFASHRYEGVLYFGQPIGDGAQLDSVYTVRVFPTAPAPPEGVNVPLRVRNVFIEEGAGSWQVTDLLEAVNDSSVTWTAAEDGGVVWRYPLPPGATNPHLVDGQGSRDGIRFEGESLVTSAAFPPGERLWVIQYDIPTLETSFPLPGYTGFVEFLVREPAPAMRVEGLTAAEPIELERDSQYRRWWTEDATDRVARVQLGEEPVEPRAWVAVGLAIFLVLAGSVFMLRRRPDVEGPSRLVPGASDPATDGDPGLWGEARDRGDSPDGIHAPPRPRRELLLAVARIDEALDADPEPAEAARLRARREALLEALSNAWASSPSTPGR